MSPEAQHAIARQRWERSRMVDRQLKRLGVVALAGPRLDRRLARLGIMTPTANRASRLTLGEQAAIAALASPRRRHLRTCGEILTVR